MLRLLFLFLLVLSTIGVNADRVFTIKNECPTIIKVFLEGTQLAELPAYGGTFDTRPMNDNFEGFIYSDANGGTPDTPSGTMVGFLGKMNYYYIAKDAKLFNIGVAVRPTDRSPSDGFCLEATCTDVTCPLAFHSPPPSPDILPPPGPAAQFPPLLECKEPNTGFTVTFCPGGTFPPPPPRNMKPNPTSTKCLTAPTNEGLVLNGTAVFLADCNNASRVQRWFVVKGFTKIYLAGTEYCVDAGPTTPGNGVAMIIEKCFDGVVSQEWLYNDDNQIILAGKGQCLEPENGASTDPIKVQTWECQDGNTNQLWYVV